MKLICFLLASSLLQAAGIRAQKITITVKNAPISKVFEQIEHQTNYLFMANANLLAKAKPVTLNIKEVTAEQAIKESFTNQPFGYEINGRIITVVPLKNIAEPITLVAVSKDPITISGKVLDEFGEPLSGVSIAVKGKTGGTTTDDKGQYTIKLQDNEDMLVFTYSGFVTQQVSVKDRSSFDVVLKVENKALSEVVVIGYGTQKRENVVGSISTIKGEQLKTRPVTQLQNALTGQLPGVTVTQRNGRPGAASGSISVRGVGSFGADPSVLILVDGIPVGGFNDIDPNDVENISVLKDASSAAIYGARAANGVILVTTKSGVKGKAKVTYNGYVGMQVATATPEFVDAYEFAKAFNEGSPSPVYTDEDLQKYKDGTDRDHFPNTNFIDSILKKSAIQSGHNISITGGNDKNQYHFSVGYVYQDGLVANNDYNRYNVRMNMITSITDKLKLTTRAAFISSDVKEPGTGVLGVIDQAIKLPANMVAKYSNGTYGEGYNNQGTPISTLASKSFYRSSNENLNGNVRLDYEVLRGLKLSGIGSYVITNGAEHTFDATQLLRGDILKGPNKLTEGTTKSRYYTVQGLADYNKTFGRHSITALVGFSFEKTTFNSLELSRSDFPSNDKPIISLGSPATQQTNGAAYIWAIESEFARVNYSYAGKYLLEGVVRRDGSSRFPTTNKYAYFPSVAVGWRIGQENFIKENAPWLSELKIKASRGVLGNQNISNYPYQNTLGTNINDANTQSSIYSLGGTVVQGVSRTQIVDTTLHWESTRTTDVGLEFGLFKNKVTGSVTWFDRYTYDILVRPSASLSTVLGFDISQQNSGSLRNRGWEFTLNYNDHVGKVGISINTNFSIINNKALDLGVGNVTQPNGMVGNGSTLFIGYPMQLYYGYLADGLFVDQADIDKWPKYNAVITPKTVPGDIRYKDISGPDGKPDGVIDPTYDRVYLGSQIPKYTYGINLAANYAGFDISMLLQGIAGVQGNLTGNFGWAFNNGANVQRWQYDGRWTPDNPNPNAIYPRLEVLSNAGNANTPLSSFWILNGSYLRIKNAQLGYTFSNQLLAKAKISRARIYFSGENLLTLDNYRKGWDPEVNTGGSFYPIIRNYTLGLNITF